MAWAKDIKNIVCIYAIITCTHYFHIQVQALENEKKRLQSDLELAYKQHKEETEIQQLQNFQVCLLIHATVFHHLFPTMLV